MIDSLVTRLRGSEGQAAVEYAMILSAIVGVVVVAYVLIGNSVSGLLTDLVSKLDAYL